MAKLISPEQWQLVQVANGVSLQRLKVPGGWLVRDESPVLHYLPDRGLDSGYGDYRMSMCFMPDPEHKWLTD